MAEEVERTTSTGLVEHIAQGIWATRQAQYRFAGYRLKDWEDVPDDTREWMLSQARAAKSAYEYWHRKDPKPATGA